MLVNRVKRKLHSDRSPTVPFRHLAAVVSENGGSFRLEGSEEKGKLMQEERVEDVKSKGLYTFNERTRMSLNEEEDEEGEAERNALECSF